MMKILFDQSGNPINPGEIKNAVDDFGKSYAATVNNIIRSSQRSLTQDIFAENVARLMANFKMTRKGLFNGIKYLNGAVQKFLPLGALRNFPIFEFNKNSKIITKVLSDIDAKIELNNRINRELEAMAKTLYDYWFVQFDFPIRTLSGVEGYKSSGGKMVYNAELKREIPEGWDVKYLKDLLTFEKGVEPGSSEYIDYPINENFIK